MVVDNLLRSSATEHKIDTAYHPQTNGLTERLNRTLTDMLAMYVPGNYHDWDAALPCITFAYNSSRHETAGFSPFYLLYGCDPVLPFDTLLSSGVKFSMNDYARDAITLATHARDVARQRLTTSQASQKRRNDQHRDTQFSPGSLVLLWTPLRRVGLAEKLLCHYSGPYKITRQLSDVSLLPHINSNVVHVARLKPCIPASTGAP